MVPPESLPLLTQPPAPKIRPCPDPSLSTRCLLHSSYAMTSLMRPAPMVRPPSRIAKRCVLSMATGAISSTSSDTLSPGITISTPGAKCTLPVTSVVRK